MIYAIEAMEPTIFNWVEEFLVTLKEQLTKCRWGELKKFGYNTILVSFFFDRVPHMRPQVEFTNLRARDPHMLWWIEIMAHLSGVGSRVKYRTAFLRWLDDQLLMIEEYAYAGPDFQGDPDLPLPACA